MIFLRSLQKIWLGFKYCFWILAIIIAIDIVLNLLLWLIYLFASIFKLRPKKDSIAINAVINKDDTILLKNNGFNVREEPIGSGYYGTVYKAYYKVNDKIEVMAIKVIDVIKYLNILKNINSTNIEDMRKSFNNAIIGLQKINNPNVVYIEKVDKVFNESNQITKLFLFSKLAQINLNDFLLTKRPNGVGEECARLWFQQISEAVLYLHEVNKVSHLNLKPENILLFTNSKESKNNIGFNAKLADCGITALFPNSGKVYTKTDPIFVISPLETSESQSVSLSKAYDIYTLGVVLALLMKGDIENIVPNNKSYALFAHFSERYLEDIEDKELSHLLNAMLNTSTESRIQIKAVLSHPWVVRSLQN